MHTIHQPAFAERIRAASAGSPLVLGTGRDFPKTRWQRLQTLGAWVKRDDEVSLTMSGPKFRKLCGMHELLAAHEAFVSYGSARSAFLLALAQLCLQQGKTLELFLLKSTPWQAQGMDRIYRAVFGQHRLHWVEREDWAGISDLLPKDRVVIPEGGVGEAAFWGAMSLGLDIVEQMRDMDVALEHIWIDAGTGLTAQALIQALGGLLDQPPHVHVVLCAGSEEAFHEGLRGHPGPGAPYTLYRPTTARSYGSTNQTIWQTIERYLTREGLLLDPIYTAKLFLAFEAQPTPNSLIIHSGGGLNNFGFEEFLRADGALAKR